MLSIKNLLIEMFSGFLGVYFSGYILHVTRSWPVVFIFIAIIDALGCIIYLLFGSGQAII